MTQDQYQVLEERLTRIEEAVRQVKELLQETKGKDDDLEWWQKIAGRHKNSPVFDEMVRLGRQMREADRPQARAKKTNSPKKGSAPRSKKAG